MASAGVTETVGHRIRLYETHVSFEYLPLVSDWILSSRQYNLDLLDRNSHLAAEIAAKVALLSDPELEMKILNGRFFNEAETTTLDGITIPVFVVFTADSMRAGALENQSRSIEAVSILEEFMGVPWGPGFILEWYGFRLGHTGGGRELMMEDKETYADRAAPQDVIIPHELAHTYVGNEDLTQFLEVYAFNVAEAGSVKMEDWVWKRGDYQFLSPENQGVWALMDIHSLIGPEATGQAYAIIQALPTPAVSLSRTRSARCSSTMHPTE